MKSSRSSQSKSKSAAKKTTKSSGSRAANGRSSSNGTASKSSAARAKSSTTARGSRSAASKSKSTTRGRSKASSTPREGLTKVLQDGLKDIYYAEKQLYKSLNKLSKAVTNEQLTEAFQMHREETGQQVERLEECFELLEMRAQGKKCPAMDGLIEEANEHIEEMEKGPALDAALIVGAQKVEHYEIAAYGSLRTFAEALGYPECAAIFQEILDQESATDVKLTEIAQIVNQEALAEDEEGGNLSKVTASAADEDMEDE